MIFLGEITMFCGKCGGKAIEGADFCGGCGEKLDTPLPQQQSYEPVQNKAKGFKLTTIISIILLSIGFAGALFISLVSFALYGRVFFFDGYNITAIGWITCFALVSSGTIILLIKSKCSKLPLILLSVGTVGALIMSFRMIILYGRVLFFNRIMFLIYAGTDSGRVATMIIWIVIFALIAVGTTMFAVRFVISGFKSKRTDKKVKGSVLGVAFILPTLIILIAVIPTIASAINQNPLDGKMFHANNLANIDINDGVIGTYSITMEFNRNEVIFTYRKGATIQAQERIPYRHSRGRIIIDGTAYRFTLEDSERGFEELHFNDRFNLRVVGFIDGTEDWIRFTRTFEEVLQEFSLDEILQRHDDLFSED